MDSLLSISTDVGLASGVQPNYQPKLAADAMLLNSIGVERRNKEDKVNVAIDDMMKSLSITAQKVIEKLNELLKGAVPGGVQSLDPNEFTSEKVATRIVDQIGGLFSGFAKQNPKLSDEELVDKFMELARSGVEQGYGEAYEILEGLGAFEFDGVRDGVEKTKELLAEKLNEFEMKLRRELGLEPEEVTPEAVAAPIVKDFLALGGVQTLDIAA